MYTARRGSRARVARYQAPSPVAAMMSPEPSSPCPLSPGDDGGLEGLMRPVILLGSPDKKKHRLSTQGLLYPPPSEYAPPSNTSSNILIATNPFDDEYSISPPQGNPYFRKSDYSASRNLHAFRIPANMPPKLPSQFSGSYSFRDQPPSFHEERPRLAFSKPRFFSAVAQDRSNFDGRIRQTITMPGQHFRSYPLEGLHLQVNNVESATIRGPSGNLQFNPQLDTSHPLITKVSNSKQDFQPAPNRKDKPNSATHNNSDDVIFVPPDANPRMHKIQYIDMENPYLNIDDIVNGHTNGTRGRRPAPKVTKADVTVNEKCNRWLQQLSSHGLYPCGICTNNIHDAEDALRCEASCGKLFHRVCTGMTETAFTLLIAEPSAIWGCDSCMAKKDIELVRTKKSIC
ncbi:pygopus homolog 1 [Discoglossus pictus]